MINVKMVVINVYDNNPGKVEKKSDIIIIHIRKEINKLRNI